MIGNLKDISENYLEVVFLLLQLCPSFLGSSFYFLQFCLSYPIFWFSILHLPSKFIPGLDTMGRARSKSVVQSIASDVATYSKDNLRLVNESTEARDVHNPVLSEQAQTFSSLRNRPRGYSVSDVALFDSTARIEVNGPQEIPLYPFSAKEEENLLQSYLSSINYNSVLDSQYIDDINKLADDSILAFCSECDANVSYMQSLLNEGTAVIDKLSALTSHYDTVMKETDDFSYHSSQLLDQQRLLEQKTTEMNQVILIFEPLDNISATLVSSGNNIIHNGRISTILSQVQDYLDFLAQHDTYKDSESYAMRYRQCMTRGLTLVMNYLVDVFRSKLADVSSRLNSKTPPSALNLDIMMYSEFNNDLERQSENTRVPELVNLIIERCSAHDEYLGLLSDVFQLYFKVRLMLINAQQQMLPQKDDTLSTVKHCKRLTSAYKRLVEKEFALFCRYFPLKSSPPLVQRHINDQLYSFLRQILDPFYDDMRNRILREVSITELCQLTNLLSSYYEFDEQTSMISGSNDSPIEYGELFENIMSDTQSRLIFRIQNFIDNKLLKYSTKPEDLQLANRKNSSEAEARHILKQEFEDNLFPELYYPVGIALSILSQLYELVSPLVFDDMAHYIVHSCIIMLKGGALKLAITHLGVIEARLYYLKNLLMLNNQLDNFEIQYVRTETSLDFTSGLLELLGILRQGSLYVNLNTKGGFLELVKKSAPRVINNMMDAKTEIEMELTNTVNEIVTECTNMICSPILANDLREPQAKCVELRDNILTKVPQLHKLILLFVNEPEIVAFLLQQLSTLMQRAFDTFYKKLEDELAGLTKAEELNEIMEPEVFLNFFSETISSLQEKAEEAIDFDERLLDDLHLREDSSKTMTDSAEIPVRETQLVSPSTIPAP